MSRHVRPINDIGKRNAATPRALRALGGRHGRLELGLHGSERGELLGLDGQVAQRVDGRQV